MNRSTHLFIFGFLSLLVLFISGAFAACSFISPTACDCNPQNTKGCDASVSIIELGIVCGKEIKCERFTDLYLVDVLNRSFCHLGPCRNCTSGDSGRDSICNDPKG